ncbi:MAG: glutathione S-transferase family protein [Halioglobus sp.]
MLELYHSLISPCAQKVRIVLHEKQLPYTSHVLNIVAKENLSPQYLRLNPEGVVPTLVHDGVPIVESSLICEYLDELFPEPRLLRGSVHQRLRERLWAKRVDEKVHPALGALAWTISMRRQFLERGEAAARDAIMRVPDPVRRSRQLRILADGAGAPDVRDALAVYRQFCEKTEATLTQSEWLSGEAFGFADVVVTPYIHALYQYDIAALFIGEQSATAAWFTRLQERPAYQDGVAALIPRSRAAQLAGWGRECRAVLSERIDEMDRVS